MQFNLKNGKIWRKEGEKQENEECLQRVLVVKEIEAGFFDAK